MTAKKMADIFFGKFSELISTEESSSSGEASIEKIANKTPTESKNQNQKILIYAAALAAVAILIYFFL